MNDALHYFRENTDETSSLKLNMDELFQKKQQQDLNTLNTYNKILKRIHNKILYTSKHITNMECCWYILPEIMVGIPKYDKKDCTVYVIEKLRENGFIVKYIHPNLLFITWKSWIPTYVRNEIKKKTGYNVDEYGNFYTDNDVSNHSEHTEQKNINNLDDTLNNLMFKSSNNKKNYKDIKTYNPSGTLIYNNNYLNKLNS